MTEPVVTDAEIDAMRLSNFADVAALQDRCLQHMDDPKYVNLNPHVCRYDCTSQDRGWILYEVDGNHYAKPCPIHFPEYVEPDKRAPDTEKARREQKHKESLGWME